MIRVVRLLSLIVALASTVWAIRLLFFSGINVVIFGHLIRSNDPWKPFEWAFGSAIVFALTGGVPATIRAWRRARQLLASMPVVGRFVSPRGLAIALAVAVFALGTAYSTTTAAGADSSGYVSEADAFLHGGLKPPQPWVGQVPWPNPRWSFTPLGWKPVQDEAPYAQAPTYSPGLPLLMALAKIIGGQTALFLVVPLCGALAVLSTYGAARRLAGPSTGLAAAWLIGTSPLLLWQQVFPMSDVPVAAWWATSFFFLVGDGPLQAFAAGLAAAVAILIRPNLFFLVPVMSLWFLIRKGDGLTFARRIRDGVIFGLGVLPGIVFILVLFNYLFGSPFESGYGKFADLLDRTHIPANAKLYFQWGMEVQPTFITIGVIGLFVPVFVWAKGNQRRAAFVLALMVGAVTMEYLTYTVFDGWPFLRFFLPAWPLLAIGGAGVVMAVHRRLPSTLRMMLVASLIALGAVGVRTARERFAFELWHGNRRYTAAAMILHDLSPPNSAVFAMEHSGSMRYYSGRIPIRSDEVPEDWLDRTVEWLAKANVHCYAVMDEWELPDFRKRFATQEKLHAIDTPLVLYQSWNHGAIVYIYDLTTPPAPGTTPRVITETDPGHWRDWPGGPVPRLDLSAAVR